MIALSLPNWPDPTPDECAVLLAVEVLLLVLAGLRWGLPWARRRGWVP